MAEVQIPLIISAGYDSLNGNNANYSPTSYIYNGEVHKLDDDSLIVAKRRGLTIIGEAPAGAAAGYGIYVWQTPSINEIFAVVYTSGAYRITSSLSYTSEAVLPTSPWGRVKWCETSDPYVIVNTQAGALSPPSTAESCYYISEAAGVYTATQLTNATHGFPTQELASGIVELDGFVFVATQEGRIYNSNVSAPTTWTSTDFLTASREQDIGVHICKHNNDICLLGSRTIEFFYNAANPAGSPLTRREDIVYNIGVLCRTDGYSYAIDSDDTHIAFIGSRGSEFENTSAAQGIYLIHKFGLNKVSNTQMDAKGYDPEDTISLFSFRGKRYILFRSIIRSETLVYDTTVGLWYKWNLEGDPGSEYINLRGTHNHHGIHVGGDIYEMTNSTADDFGSVSINIKLEVITPDMDFNTYSDKYQRSLMLKTAGGGVGMDGATVSWSDDFGVNWSTPRALNLDSPRPIYRLGKFRQRRFKFTFDTDDYVEIAGCSSIIDGGAVARSET